MKFIKEKNTFIFIVIVVCFTVIDIIFWNRLSFVRKLVTIFAVLAAAHEIEEKIWPGGFFEAFVHTAGIAIHHMKKPYTPGLVTAWLLAVLAVIAIFNFNSNKMVSMAGYVAGTLIMIVSFLCLNIFIIWGFGDKMKKKP